MEIYEKVGYSPATGEYLTRGVFSRPLDIDRHDEASPQHFRGSEGEWINDTPACNIVIEIIKRAGNPKDHTVPFNFCA